jgi:[acyl-carrier-protein] S-malonyltransferase
MKKFVFMFDGQGAFKPGIGKELYDTYPPARDVIDKSSSILGYDLTVHLWKDQASDTSGKTSIAQPAISAVSLAYAAVLKDLGLTADVSLGHSLGEITAVVHCRIVSFSDGMQIIQKRGEVMERGGKQGTMMAVINIKEKQLAEICQRVTDELGEPVVVANINAPNQIVISGSKECIKLVAQQVVQHQGKGIPLRVGGAWHSPYLTDAAREFAEFLDTVTFRKPESKFYSVMEQRLLDDPEAIKESLSRQMLAQVNWITAIRNLVALHYLRFLEIGPSNILKNLVDKIDPNLNVETVALYPDLEKLMQALP